MANRPSDSELVELARAGDAEAFGELVSRHMRGVYAVARAFAQNHADADDLSQEAFLRAYRGLGSFRGRAAFRTWLLRIAANVCASYAGRRRSPPALPREVARMADPAAGPAETAALQEQGRLVWGLVEELPADLRVTLQLVVGQGLTHQEAADVLGCPRNTVSWRMFRARELLRERLAPLIGEWEEAGE